MKSLKKEALDYHSNGRKGKIEVVPTKPYTTQRDLSLAYSPGVAEPCLEISENKSDVYKYTSKGNFGDFYVRVLVDFYVRVNRAINFESRGLYFEDPP